jgi:AraC-like DNA-binding protein
VVADDPRRTVLRAGDYSLSTVAERVGYTSDYALSKAFRRDR